MNSKPCCSYLFEINTKIYTEICYDIEFFGIHSFKYTFVAPAKCLLKAFIGNDESKSYSQTRL